MSQALAYLQASLSRAINDGQRSLSVSTLDLKEVLAELASLHHKALDAESGGLVVGFARPEMVEQMRSGNALYITIRRKKNAEYTMRLSTKNIWSADAEPVADDSETMQD